MKKQFCLIAVTILSVISIFAQNNKDAENIINNFIQSVSNSAIKADFVMDIADDNNTPLQSQKGTFIMKGNMFVFDMEDIQIFFDGKTQWTYMKADNEVTITEPTEEELAEINPIVVLSIYKSTCNIQFSSTEKPADSYVIDLTPKSKNADFDKIEVRAKKTNQDPTSIKIYSSETYNMFITLTKFEKNVQVTNKTFAFDKSKYSGVYVNDMR